MIALGLLAKHPNIRKGILNELDQMGKVSEVRVVGFNGRETDAPLGVWGSIAEQLGKKELFKDYYSPLSAPGQMEALFNKSAELKAINLIIAEMAVRYALTENPVTDYSQRVDFDFFQLPSVE